MTRTVDYDRLAASAPINRQAAIMRDGGGGPVTPTMPAFVDHWDAPPPQERTPSPDTPRLEGRVFGDGMRVVRYHGRRADSARWLVRCPCGAYELRRTRAILTAPPDHACQACTHNRRLRRRRDDPADATPTPSLKIRLTLDELLYIRALVTGQGRQGPRSVDGKGFTAQDAMALAEKLDQRLSGIEPG